MGGNQCSPSNARKGKKETTQEKQTTTKATVQPKTTCSKKNWTPNTRYNRQELLTSKLKPTQLRYLYVQQKQMLLNSILYHQTELNSNLHVYKKQGLLKSSLVRKQQLLLHRQPRTSLPTTFCNRH